MVIIGAVSLSYSYTCSLDNRLLTMEREHDISQRWTDSTPDFQAIQVIARTNEHKTALGSIKEKASELFYLSNIRRRFIGEFSS